MGPPAGASPSPAAVWAAGTGHLAAVSAGHADAGVRAVAADVLVRAAPAPLAREDVRAAGGPPNGGGGCRDDGCTPAVAVVCQAAVLSPLGAVAASPHADARATAAAAALAVLQMRGGPPRGHPPWAALPGVLLAVSGAAVTPAAKNARVLALAGAVHLLRRYLRTFIASRAVAGCGRALAAAAAASATAAAEVAAAGVAALFDLLGAAARPQPRAPARLPRRGAGGSRAAPPRPLADGWRGCMGRRPQTALPQARPMGTPAAPRGVDAAAAAAAAAAVAPPPDGVAAAGAGTAGAPASAVEQLAIASGLWLAVWVANNGCVARVRRATATPAPARPRPAGSSCGIAVSASTRTLLVASRVGLGPAAPAACSGGLAAAATAQTWSGSRGGGSLRRGGGGRLPGRRPMAGLRCSGIGGDWRG
ncbi:hypothetical protein I4F81_010550 [Pyropia yezoensis]|uniref:Uncharacterized protein n=1 Tax=Pyropia yezoensis TaxID=2788 RepID=A0ACC3CCM4_PYRYE|nr:hypothetical protein I4F81_010550 [Neopyropia yezoensis]